MVKSREEVIAQFNEEVNMTVEELDDANNIERLLSSEDKDKIEKNVDARRLFQGLFENGEHERVLL